VILEDQLQEIYEALFSTYGPQNWWPGETLFEIMVGAVLVQNTTWQNAERAIRVLIQKTFLDPVTIVSIDPSQLGQWIRSVGYYNIKARYLQNFCRWYLTCKKDLEVMPTATLRRALLSVKGIGPETADDILLYACKRSVFVIDSFTRRLFSRLGFFVGNESYEKLRTFFQNAVSPTLYSEYHALIVRHAKEVCKKRQPACRSCVLGDFCPRSLQ